ncbi:MAG: hypothetical protein WA902_11030 [Thermosynechococcaceae cyanobacterium]
MSERLDRIESILEQHLEADAQWKARHQEEMAVLRRVYVELTEISRDMRRSVEYLLSQD